MLWILPSRRVRKLNQYSLSESESWAQDYPPEIILKGTYQKWGSSKQNPALRKGEELGSRAGPY